MRARSTHARVHAGIHAGIHTAVGRRGDATPDDARRYATGGVIVRMHHSAIGECVNGAGVLERFTRISILLILFEIAQRERHEAEILERTTTPGLHAWSILEQTAQRGRRQSWPMMQRLGALHRFNYLQFLRDTPSVAAEAAQISAAAGWHDAVGSATVERQKGWRGMYRAIVVIVFVIDACNETRTPRYHFSWC